MATQLRIFNIPPGLHQQLKIWAAELGISLNQLVIELIKNAIERDYDRFKKEESSTIS